VLRVLLVTGAYLWTGKRGRRCDRGALVLLLAAWNVATAPYVPRTEAGHARCHWWARAIDGRLRASGFVFGRDWRELSDGRRVLAERWL
jgi:hypothetical protein